MDIWKVLEIEKTKDKDEIKNAYRKKLVKCNPEENQKAFMELREAYDEAMRLSNMRDIIFSEDDCEDRDGEDEKAACTNRWGDNEIGRWMSKVDAVYCDIKRRINVGEWERLLDDDVCFSLDTKLFARDELLKYTMKHNCLPQCIWQMIDEKFMIVEYKEELYEIFPQDYIDKGIIDNIRYRNFVDFDRIESEGGDDYDQFIRLCNLAYSQISDGKIEEAWKNIETMESLKIYHPYKDVCIIRCYLAGAEYSKAEEVLHGLVEKYPDDIHILKCSAVCHAKQDRYQEAKEDYIRILEKEPRFYDVYIELGTVYFKMEDYIRSKETFDKAYDIHKSNYLQECIEKCIDELNKYYQKKYYESPYNIETCIELARTRYQKSEIDSAIDFLEKVTPDKENRLEYVHLLGCCYMYKEKYEKAIPYIDEWVRGTERLKDDGTEKTKKAIKRLVYAYMYMGFTIEKLYNDRDAENEYTKKAIATGVNTIDVYEYKARMAFARKEYKEIPGICEEILKFDANSSLAYTFRAQALYEMGYVRDAITQWDICIEIEPYDVSLYMKKIECLFDVGEYEKADEILKFFDDNGVKSERLDLYREISRWKKGDYKEAFNNFMKMSDLTRENEEEDNEKLLSDIYFEMAGISLYKEQDIRKAEYYIDKSLEKDSENVKALNMKAYILYKNNEFDKALWAYKKVIREKPYHLSANGYIGEILEAMHRFDEAIEYYTNQINILPNAYMYLSRGWCFATLFQYEEARKDYEKSIQFDDEAVSAYRNLGNTYMYDEMEEIAIEYYEKALENDKKKGEMFIYKNICIAYMRIGKYKEAIEAMQRYIKQDSHPKHIAELAQTYMECGEYEKALEEFYRYAGISDNRYENIERICDCMLLSGREKDAIQIIKEMKEVTSHNEKLKQQIDIWRIEITSVCIRMHKKKYLGLKFEMAQLINCYVKNDRGNGNFLILIRFLLELRHHNSKKIKYNLPLMSEVTKKFVNDINARIVTCKNEARHLCDKAVLNLEYGNLNQALEYAGKAVSIKKCHTCRCPKCAKALFIKAVILEIMERKEEACEFYMQAAEADKSEIIYAAEYERIKNG